jgi:hypothetical protein
MRQFTSVLALFLAAAVTTTAWAADEYRVVDHLRIVKTGDERVNPIQPTALTNDVKLDDITAAQRCKDLGPVSNDPDTEADIINRCLARNSILNLNVVSTPVAVKGVLR